MVFRSSLNSLYQITTISIPANRELNFPHSNKSGTKINSSVFIVAMITICVAALSFVLNRLKIHMAIITSDSPMHTVSSLACSVPKIRDTISSCLGTRFNTLQHNPLMIQIMAMP